VVIGVGVEGLYAQTLVRSGSLEVGPFVGVDGGNQGVNYSTAPNKFNIMAGGNITFAMNKHILPYLEYSYFPGITRTSTDSSGGFKQTDGRVAISDFHGGLHIRLPIREKPIVPYLVAGFGLLHNGTSTTTLTEIGGPPFLIPGGKEQFTNPGSNSAAINCGLGIRYYINQRFGMRVELKGYRAFSLNYDYSRDQFAKAEFGFFYQMH
jgi:hypothetical protein